MINLSVAVYMIVSIFVLSCKKAIGNSQNKVSQEGLKMKRLELQEQIAEENRNTELEEIERRNRISQGLEVSLDESRVGLREALDSEEFENRLERRENVIKQQEENRRVGFEQRKDTISDIQRELGMDMVNINIIAADV